MSDPRPARALVLYDSDCGFCQWCLAKLLAWDRHGRLRPVALATPQADRLLADMDADTRMASWHLVLPDGRRYSAGRGFAPLLRLLPHGGGIAALVDRAPGLADRLYFAVANRRTLAGRLVSARSRARARARIAARTPGSGGT